MVVDTDPGLPQLPKLYERVHFSSCSVLETEAELINNYEKK